jgi:hypothetical protein
MNLPESLLRDLPGLAIAAGPCPLPLVSRHPLLAQPSVLAVDASKSYASASATFQALFC